MPSNSLKYLSVITLVLSLYGNIRYMAGRAGHDIGDPEKDPYFRVGFTPFTANILVVLIFWGFLHLLQISFVTQYFFAEETSQHTETSSNPVNAALGGVTSSAHAKVAEKVGVHFNLFNFLHFLWLLLFVSGHYILAELVIIVNLFNIVGLYTSHKTYKDGSIASNLLIHIPVAAFPFSWLMYALFWNGAVVFNSQSLVARIIANIFIWDFLFVPIFFLAIYRDWAFGFGSAVLLLGLGLGQLFTKVFALQWIFAFVISGVLFLSSVAVLSVSIRNTGTSTDSENAPLIGN
ncbi:CYFA0S01e13256g1_1 [Cyberlindnera fabianii]|uniref:CYFA0S01e13256g1_1 n=1 Tax=Cyberlindnera fabianii TaxID=36022 RepID=A0A061AKE4_CYBFA|nr:hypothetical protein BON22_0261 [Cyberlindnera fabianii]CDR37610.1 CYFA0S01e13256g1_1 [Cyberlindnera fabianii]